MKVRIIATLALVHTLAAYVLSSPVSGEVGATDTDTTPKNVPRTGLRSGAAASIQNPADSQLICLIAQVEIDAIGERSADISGNRYQQVPLPQDEEVFECIPLLSVDPKTVYRIEDDFSHSIELPEAMMEDHRHALNRGELFVAVPGGIIDDDMVLAPDKGTIHVIPPPQLLASDWHLHHRRRLEENEPIVGTHRILVIRASAKDVSPDLTAQEFRDYIFGTPEVNIVSQFSHCSSGKLHMEPAVHGSINGVLDITLDKPLFAYTRIGSMINAVTAAALELLGVEHMTDVADHIMYCLPPNDAVFGRWAASAPIGHWRSVYNNNWCAYSSAILHEFGHNLGLLHANQDGTRYNDRTGYMSASHRSFHWPAKCYNAQNHWKLGWFLDKSTQMGPSSRILKIAAFVDYDMAAHDEFVLLKVGSLYFQYNRKKLFNAHTEEKGDQLVIVREYDSGTDLIAGLDMANRRLETEENGEPLIVQVCQVVMGDNVNTADYMVVAVQYGRSAPEVSCASVVSTDAPTGHPSSRPSPAPSIRPSASPSASPSNPMPSAMPTAMSMAMPTAMPSAMPSSPPSTLTPSAFPTRSPTWTPSSTPSIKPSTTARPSSQPSLSFSPSEAPSPKPSSLPSWSPTEAPSTRSPTVSPSASAMPTMTRTNKPSLTPTTSMQPSTSSMPTVSDMPSTSSMPSLSVAPSLPPSISMAPSTSMVPTHTPTISALPSMSVCDDNPWLRFWVQEDRREQHCIWLASRPTRQQSLCRNQRVASICRETCGLCDDDCHDDESFVFFDARNHRRDCAYLSIRHALWSAYCVPGSEVYTRCAETCNSCPPEPAPTLYHFAS